MTIMFPEDMSPRRKNRIFAIQFMYSWSINKNEELIQIGDIVDAFIDSYFSGEGNQYKFGKELAVGAVENIDVIDDLIKEHATHWSLDRIAIVDLAILRIAIYEMLFRDDIPPIVAMNEAIDIGKILSTDESGRFLNGVLDGIKKKLTRPLREAGR
ncbi:MAG: transcription antitermination factor NusB [Puniceicoccales bacterium]|jgi:N utilization substance protein B|nr:transcription antitermination factor NusB [Puniceicoccales bacterium]